MIGFLDVMSPAPCLERSRAVLGSGGRILARPVVGTANDVLIAERCLQPSPQRAPTHPDLRQANRSRPVYLIEGCRSVVVGERQDVAVNPQRGGGVAMPEPVLGLQDVSLGHQYRGHGMAEPVKGHVRMAGVGTGLGKPVREAGRRQAGGVIGAAGEQPRPESRACGSGQTWSDRPARSTWPERWSECRRPGHPTAGPRARPAGHRSPRPIESAGEPVRRGVAATRTIDQVPRLLPR